VRGPASARRSAPLVRRRQGQPAGHLRTSPTTSSATNSGADLVTTYADLPLGAVDATVIALAERLAITEIATLDTATSPPSAPPHQRRPVPPLRMTD